MPSKVDEINALIEAQGLDWTAVDTQVSRLTIDELSHMCRVGGVQVVPPQNFVSLTNPCLEGSTILKGADWDDVFGSTFCTPGRLGLKSQGLTDACTAFATVACCEANLKIDLVARQLGLFRPYGQSIRSRTPEIVQFFQDGPYENNLNLSESDLWFLRCFTPNVTSCPNQSSCPKDSWSVEASLEQVRIDGLLPEQSWPWNWVEAKKYCLGIGGAIGTPPVDRSQATKILNWWTIHATNGQKDTIDLVKKWLLNCGPVIAVLDARRDFFYYGTSTPWSRLEKDKWGIYEDSGGFPFVGRHAVCIVGYGERIYRGLRKEYWIIKNSLHHDYDNTGYPWGYRNYGLIRTDCCNLDLPSVDNSGNVNYFYGITMEKKRTPVTDR
jgi:hypothetical protein